MLTIAQTHHKKTADLLKATLDTIEHYGFSALDDTLAELKPAKKVKATGKLAITHTEERRLCSLTKSFLEHGLHTAKTDTQLIYHIDTNPKSICVGLHIVDNDNAFSEATIISTVNTILKNSGIKDAIIHINSIGDRESKQKFVRELTQYFRDNLNDIPAYARTDITGGNPLKALHKLHEKNHPIAKAAPSSMDALNDSSRSRLREVLEYIESIDIDYELNPSIIGSSDCWSHIVFEVRAPHKDLYTTIVRGGRYNALARRGFNRKLESTGALLEIEIKGATKQVKRVKKSPRFFMAHIGTEAKKRTLHLLAHLHKAGIQITQKINATTIGDQLKEAEKMQAPYIVIIGHKEALEDAAIVRNNTTRTQKTIPLNHVASYLGRLKV